MGRMKELLIETEERGYGEPPETLVCENCFSDEGLIELIIDSGKEGFCSYCKKRSLTVLPLAQVISHIMESIVTEWRDAADSGTPYITREGGYQGPVVDTYDLLNDEEPIEANHQELADDINNTIYDGLWARPFSMPFEEDAVHEDWDVLVNIIQHHIRFITFHDSASEIFNNKYWVYNDPRSAIEQIANAIKRLKLIYTLPQGSPIYRARFSEIDKYFTSASDLGTVPFKLAKQANRMSPVGIPMFYGALDSETAKAELDAHKSGFINYGEFYASRDLILIDFTQKISIPSIYSSRRGLRSDIRLMNGFINDFSKPIKRDGSEHIEYIPTQVITEYLRYNYTHNSNRIDGILYNSVHNNKKACVIFIENEMCQDKNVSRSCPNDLILFLKKCWREKVIK